MNIKDRWSTQFCMLFTNIMYCFSKCARIFIVVLYATAMYHKQTSISSRLNKLQCMQTVEYTQHLKIKTCQSSFRKRYGRISNTYQVKRANRRTMCAFYYYICRNKMKQFYTYIITYALSRMEYLQKDTQQIANTSYLGRKWLSGRHEKDGNLLFNFEHCAHLSSQYK